MVLKMYTECCAVQFILSAFVENPKLTGAAPFARPLDTNKFLILSKILRQ